MESGKAMKYVPHIGVKKEKRKVVCLPVVTA